MFKATNEALQGFLNDDVKVKLVFDNARNFVVCSAIMFAGVYLINTPNMVMFSKYISGPLLIASALILAMINISHAWTKLNQLSLPKYWALFLATVYAVISSELLSALFKSRILKIAL